MYESMHSFMHQDGYPSQPCSTYRSPLTTWPHLRCDTGLEEREYKIKLSLCYTVLCTIIMVQKSTSSFYRCVNYIGLFFLGLALCLPSAFVSSVFMVLYIHILKKFSFTSCSLPFSELSLVKLALDLVD